MVRGLKVGNKNDKKKRIKRGKGRQKETTLNVFSTNAAGLKSKLQSCKSKIIR